MKNPFRNKPPWVNPGTDDRIGGPLGYMLAVLQRQSLRYTPTPSTVVRSFSGEWGVITLYDPWFVSIFIARQDEPGWYWSFRIGHRFDPNVGDGNNPNEPVHHPPGATFLDVIGKSRIDHIVGN